MASIRVAELRLGCKAMSNLDYIDKSLNTATLCSEHNEYTTKLTLPSNVRDFMVMLRRRGKRSRRYKWRGGGEEVEVGGRRRSSRRSRKVEEREREEEQQQEK